MARRRRSTLKGKRGIKKANTLVSSVGGASVPASFIVLNPGSGARSVDGSEETIKDQADTAESCFVGDVVKYINLFIEASPRIFSDQGNAQGWIEWAFVCCKQTETAVPITQHGVLTLGNICANMFRQECIMTGAIPVGLNQPNVANITLKIPPIKQKISMGDEWRFITAFRDVLTTSTSTNAIRLIKSYMYKTYT